ncbi:hypothetical protein [Salirhabdus salicampi]|uniref:hypothetical protein n=1 Tax=Salirhabdus salicampi TaxID=476102 RepID=UPI0020C42309|nr:hypothetical protein [Salirhabdus salicampi]MCP8616003.1 hypothetical protein [Salirhabdus salicampi]
MEEKQRPIRLDEYMKVLQEKRRKEEGKEDVINEWNRRKGEGLTSPTASTSTEENRLFMEYMDKSNLFNIAKHDPKLGKTLTLRKFFKSKRNQQVEVYLKWGIESIHTEGKVSAVGRDFVMLTSLKDRLWIPYKAIESANIPFGIPAYSNSHQHFLYDNDLRNKLTTNFGETVGKRDILKQQFFEETLYTNLQSWKHTWIELYTKAGDKKFGRLIGVRSQDIQVKNIYGTFMLPIEDVMFVKTIRFFTILRQSLKLFRQMN